MTILGIDPGINRLGYGAVHDTGSGWNVVECGVIKPRRALAFPEKLECIAASLDTILSRTQPDIVAIEEVFLAENVRTALTIGQVMGLVMGLGLRRRIRFTLIPVREIKKNLVGTGSATKDQVQFMVSRLTGIRFFETEDVSDAIAAAISYSTARRFHDLVTRGNGG